MPKAESFNNSDHTALQKRSQGLKYTILVGTCALQGMGLLFPPRLTSPLFCSQEQSLPSTLRHFSRGKYLTLRVIEANLSNRLLYSAALFNILARPVHLKTYDILL